ncbi:MAG TPA: ATP-binding protein [Kofleriaceae bacterium]|nr:ATP-binding protein [Kofleriaceae bacterium]
MAPVSHPSDETLRMLLDSAPDAISILRGPTVLYMSLPGARMLGFEQTTEVIGRSLAEWLEPEDFAIAARRIEEVTRTSRPNSLREYRMRRNDGRLLLIEVASVPVTYEGSAAVLSFVRDVTDRKALERELAESARLASLGRLSAGVAHELNNPLTHLVLAVDVLRRTLARTPPESAAAALAMTRDKLDVIAQDIDRMAVIVRELRLFASPQSRARCPVDLRQPLESALRSVRDTHPAAARLRVERRFEDAPAVEADPIRIEQVFVNLLTNAFDSLGDAAGAASAAAGCVTVELVPAGGDAVAVHVRDEGAGIPAHMLERVFEPFFTTKAYGRGAGLGLAISRSIVQALGGSLVVESAPGRGTTFTVTLPVWHRPSDARDARAPSPCKRLRVLVVDDEPAMCRALVASLEEHEVVVAASACEALACLEGDAGFDVILCDVVMPEASGVEFHRALAASHPALLRRLVFMTGATLGSDDGRALAALPNPVLEKPFDLGRLERVLEAAALR